MNKIKLAWNSIPEWARQTIMETAEVVAAALLSYAISVLSGEQSYDFKVTLLIILKVVAKAFRAHMRIPVPDYVNQNSFKVDEFQG